MSNNKDKELEQAGEWSTFNDPSVNQEIYKLLNEYTTEVCNFDRVVTFDEFVDDGSNDGIGLVATRIVSHVFTQWQSQQTDHTKLSLTTLEAVKQRFLNKSDCYADVDNGIAIPAMTMGAVVELIQSLDLSEFINEGDGILPIEYAPKDRKILVYCPDFEDYYVAFWAKGMGNGAWCTATQVLKPTHYKELPKAPTTK